MFFQEFWAERVAAPLWVKAFTAFAVAFPFIALTVFLILDARLQAAVNKYGESVLEYHKNFARRMRMKNRR